MNNLYEAYTEKYGIYENAFLTELGGSIDDIIAKYTATQDLPFGSWLDDGFSDADNIHNIVTCEIVERYFRSISREKAVSVCNVLAIGFGDGTIKIAAQLNIEYNAYTFMCAWNKHNPECDKIVAPVSFEN